MLMELPSLPPCWFLFRKAADNPYRVWSANFLEAGLHLYSVPWLQACSRSSHLPPRWCAVYWFVLDEKSVSAWISLVLSWQPPLTSAALWHHLFLLPIAACSFTFLIRSLTRQMGIRLHLPQLSVVEPRGGKRERQRTPQRDASVACPHL